jgi:hypothetical protein
MPLCGGGVGWRDNVDEKRRAKRREKLNGNHNVEKEVVVGGEKDKDMV